MKSLADLKALREQTKRRLDLRDGENDYRIVVGMGTCGIAAGARPVLNACVEAVAKYNLNAAVTQSGCLGMCSYEPIVEVFDKEGNKTTYALMNPSKIEEVVLKHVKEGNVVSEYTIGAIK